MVQSAGRNEGARGRNYPGAESLWEHWNIAGAPKNHSIVTRTFFNAVHLLPEDLRFENWAAELASCSGRHLTSLSPCQSGVQFRQETHPFIFMLQTTMQTKCGLTNCTGNSPETAFSFSFLTLVKSCVSNKFFTLHSSFYCCLSFSSQGHQALKKKLVQKQTIFIQHSSKSRTANATAFVKGGQFSRDKEKTKQWNYYETIASFTLFDKRLGKVRHTKPDVQLSEKYGLF